MLSYTNTFLRLHLVDSTETSAKRFLGLIYMRNVSESFNGVYQVRLAESFQGNYTFMGLTSKLLLLELKNMQFRGCFRP